MNLLILQSEIDFFFSNYKVCYVFFTTSCIGILHIQIFHTLQNSEILKKWYVKLSQNTLCLYNFFTAPSCVAGSPALQHQSLSNYQLQVAVCNLFPEVLFSTCTFSMAERILFSQPSSTES